ncbi:MAG: DUF1343 domain-containing protein [Verrucomicrobia bacterium]|nr:DUF1343 domain-containing protein [Verrucomicrobiota bacterium]
MRLLPALVALITLLSLRPAPAQVKLGNEVLAAGGFKELQGKRVGLLTNPSGVNSRLESTVDLLRRAPGVKLVALFAPEHGLNADVPAGQEFPNATDARTGLPVFSLYGPGPVRRPTAAMLKGLDALVYDIQDTGCRSYTFISSMGLAMEACASNGVAFVVLDRPNPLGGERIEGPLLHLDFRSMVGQWPIPYAYGLTPGELAQMINGERWIAKPCALKVIKLENWRRWMTWRDTGLPWVPTSPYMPFPDSPLHYVSTGILGHIGGVSIGIGYTLPFQTIAAPWLNADDAANYFNGLGLRGVRFRAITYTPFYGAGKEQHNGGVQVFFTEPATAPLMAINFYALDAARKLGGKNLWAAAAESGSKMSMFDKIMGGDRVRKQLDAGTSARALVNSWKADEDAFRQRRQKYLLY